MNTTIWKFELVRALRQVISMPTGAQIIDAKVQENGIMAIWALVNPENKKQNRDIEIYGTGHEIRKEAGTNLYHRGTVIMDDGLVFHVFERI